MGHIRLLSWLLIGSLTHTALTDGTAPVVCQPIPMEASNQIADHVMVIMTGFAEQSKVCEPRSLLKIIVSTIHCIMGKRGLFLILLQFEIWVRVYLLILVLSHILLLRINSIQQQKELSKVKPYVASDLVGISHTLTQLF